MLKIIPFVFFCFIGRTPLFSQEELNAVDFEVIESNQSMVKGRIFNNQKSSIYFMINKYAGQRSYKFITDCDTLNSTSYSVPINLPPDFYSKKRMVEVKSGESQKINFKLSSKYFGVNKCDISKKMKVGLKIYVYQFNEEGVVRVIGYVLSEKMILIE